MAESDKRIQASGREQDKTSTATPSVSVTPPIPTVSEEIREELTSLMQDLLMQTHELSFEYSTSDCEKLTTCTLATKSKELFKTVKKLHTLMRKLTPPEKIRAVA